MLLKELQQLREGRMKEAMIDIIDNAISNAEIGDAPYEKAVEIIVKFAKDGDYHEILAGASNAELTAYVKDSFSKEDHEEMNESVTEAEEDGMEDEDTEEVKPKTISKADGFKVTFEEETDRVRIMDDSGNTLATMPLVTWKQLCR